MTSRVATRARAKSSPSSEATPARRRAGERNVAADARVHLRTRAALRAWLARHHQTHPGAWLVSWKPATGRPRVKYAEAVEVAATGRDLAPKDAALQNNHKVVWRDWALAEMQAGRDEQAVEHYRGLL